MASVERWHGDDLGRGEERHDTRTTQPDAGPRWTVPVRPTSRAVNKATCWFSQSAGYRRLIHEYDRSVVVHERDLHDYREEVGRHDTPTKQPDTEVRLDRFVRQSLKSSEQSNLPVHRAPDSTDSSLARYGPRSHTSARHSAEQNASGTRALWQVCTRALWNKPSARAEARTAFTPLAGGCSDTLHFFSCDYPPRSISLCSWCRRCGGSRSLCAWPGV